MNEQKATPRGFGNGNTLVVHSIFPTMQGEGPFAGQRALFIRLAHCNLQCPLCDTEYTEGAYETPIVDLLLTVDGNTYGKGSLIVLTGGEPLRQNITPFVTELLARGYRVQIETNGVMAPPRFFDKDGPAASDALTIVVSPKTNRLSQAVIERADAFKYVIQCGNIDAKDGLPIQALEHPVKDRIARPPEDVPVYVQSCDEKDERKNRANMRVAIASALRFGYTFQIQLHKHIGME